MNGDELYKPNYQPIIQWTYDIGRVETPKFDIEMRPITKPKFIWDDFILTGAL